MIVKCCSKSFKRSSTTQLAALALSSSVSSSNKVNEAKTTLPASLILKSIKNGVLTLTMNNPKRLNAWTKPMLTQLFNGMKEGASDSQVEVSLKYILHDAVFLINLMFLIRLQSSLAMEATIVLALTYRVHLSWVFHKQFGIKLTLKTKCVSKCLKYMQLLKHKQ